VDLHVDINVLEEYTVSTFLIPQANKSSTPSAFKRVVVDKKAEEASAVGPVISISSSYPP
jgi:hypothetical protein